MFKGSRSESDVELGTLNLERKSHSAAISVAAGLVKMFRDEDGG
jgi:hypothetical protein